MKLSGLSEEVESAGKKIKGVCLDLAAATELLFDTDAPLSLTPSLKRSWDSWEGATEHVHFQASTVFTPFAGHYDRRPNMLIV